MIKSFTRHLFRHVLVFSIMAMAFVSFAGASYADNCGSGDREPLPTCSYGNNLGAAGYEVTNNCSYDISVKWDIAGDGDELHGIPANDSYIGAAGKGDEVRGVYCCPSYGRCS